MIVTASVSVTAMPDAGQVSYTDIDCFPATVSVDCNNVQLVPLRLSATLRSGADNNPVDVFWRAHIQSVGSDLGTVDSPGASAQWEYSLPSDKWGKADSVVVEAYTDSSRLDMIAQKRVGIIRQNPSPFPVEGDWRPLPFKYKNGEYFLDKKTNFIFLWMNPVPGNSESHPFVDVSQNPDTTSWNAHQEYPLLGTRLLLARKIAADLIDVDNLRVKHLDGADGIFTGELKSGSVNLASGKILMNKDGSGRLAGGAVSWTKEGNVDFSEKVHLKKVNIERYVMPEITSNGQMWKVPDTADTFMDHMILTGGLSQVALSANYEFWGGRSLTIFNPSDGQVKIWNSGDPGVYIPAGGCILLTCIDALGSAARWKVLGISSGSILAWPIN